MKRTIYNAIKKLSFVADNSEASIEEKKQTILNLINALHERHRAKMIALLERQILHIQMIRDLKYNPIPNPSESLRRYKDSQNIPSH